MHKMKPSILKHSVNNVSFVDIFCCCCCCLFIFWQNYEQKSRFNLEWDILYFWLSKRIVTLTSYAKICLSRRELSPLNVCIVVIWRHPVKQSSMHAKYYFKTNNYLISIICSSCVMHFYFTRKIFSRLRSFLYFN